MSTELNIAEVPKITFDERAQVFKKIGLINFEFSNFTEKILLNGIFGR